MPLLNASVEAQLIESDGLMGLMYGGLQLSSAGNGEAVESYRVVSDRLWQLQSSATGAGWTVLDRLEGQDWPTPRFFHSAVVLHSDTPFEQESVVTPWNFSLSESDKASAAMVIFGGSETLTVQNQSEYTRPVAATYRLALSSNPELQAQNISNWTPSRSSTQPPARFAHVACRLSRGSMLIFGGSNALDLDQVYPNGGINRSLGIAFNRSAFLADTWMYVALLFE